MAAPELAGPSVDSTPDRSAGLTARRSATRMWWWFGAWLVGVAAGIAALRLAFSDDELADFRTEAVLTVIGSWAFLASGLIAWKRRPGSRLGPLMVWLGFAGLGAQLMLEARWSPVFTAGVFIGDAWIVLFVLFIVSFPSGRLSSKADLLLVAPFFLAFVPLELVWLLFVDTGEPANALLVWPDEVVADRVDWAGRLIGASGAVVLTATLARRWITASRPRRRVLTPLLAGSAALGLSTGLVIVAKLTTQPPRILNWLVLVTLIAVPVAVLGDILRARLARAAVGELVVKLSASPAPEDLRAALARALGDASLTLAYWIPEYETYVDAHGHPMRLPADGGGRAATVVERDGVQVAALVHDASLQDEPELVAAVCAAVGIAFENERLHADLRAHLEELRGSRARIIEAGDAERRRLERNLHDGAQQGLVALSLQLRRVASKLEPEGEAAQLLADARSDLSTSLQELRELAQGIHPAVLSDHGLPVALEILAARAPVPVQARVQLNDRLAEPVEVAAYYLVSEALANVGKYAQATEATVDVEYEGGRLVVEVADDGVGGADPAQGSGIRGLADRVEALGGHLIVRSPSGGGTRVRAEIPCESSRADGVVGSR